MNNNMTVKIFMMPPQYPCGPDSSCCGPIGQSEEEIKYLESALEKETGLQPEVRNVQDKNQMKDYPQIVQLVRTFGPMGLPIITLNEEVVSMGTPTVDEAVSAIQEKMNQM